MGFLGVYTAVYDYEPQGEGELEIREGELLFVLEKSQDDDWWRAKKKAENDEEDEPTGLIPNNYVEEAQPVGRAKAQFDYTRQTDEEVSFVEDAVLDVFDTSDPDWTLVGIDGDYGFAPTNYIELLEGGAAPAAAAAAPPPAPALPPAQHYRQPEPEPEYEPEPEPDHYGHEEPASPSSIQSPAAALAGILGRQQAAPPAPIQERDPSPPPQRQYVPPPRAQTYSQPEPEDEDDAPPPSLPRRPPSEAASSITSPIKPQFAHMRDEDQDGVRASPPYNRVTHPGLVDDDEPAYAPAGYHLYNINEMVSAMGKRKKLPTTLGINLATGTIFISPAKARDGQHQEWTAEKLAHYSIEGKHVFLELVRPSRSVDFHAGAKDTAQEIVGALGEIAGAHRAEGLREIIAAGSGNNQKKGKILYDFMAQGDDEVTVADGDDVIILDDTKSEEWWMVRRLKNGKEGVVPSSYVEITGTVPAAPASSAGINAGRSTIEQNRLEEERLARQAVQNSKPPADHHDSDHEREERRRSEVGPGMRVPERRSSLSVHHTDKKSSQRASKRASRRESMSAAKSKPDPSKTRTWTDRSGTFKVDAQFLGLTDGKIHLHKLNGVKIAVPVSKMSTEDLEYVEKVTGISLDEEKPLSDIRRRGTQKPRDGRAGATVVPEYDWFDFFVQCGVHPGQCERYAQNFNRDSMDGSSLPDINAAVLRTLGLKEGDILRVMRVLDAKFNRDPKMKTPEGEESGLFSGAGGALKNNTRKGRPAPPVQTNDVVDPKAFGQGGSPAPTAEQAAAAPKEDGKAKTGFEDDAWAVKNPGQAAPPAAAAAPAAAPAAQPAPAPPQQPALTGAMAELSLLTPPLQPTPAPAPAPQPQQQPPAPQAPAQPTGANSAFFNQVAATQPTGITPQPMAPQQTGFSLAGRQRPQAPPMMSQGNLLPPPPARPLSAPQNYTQQQNAFGPPPLQPQLTGLPGNMPQMAPPGQSLADMTQARLQQQYAMQQQQLQPQPTGFQPMSQFGNGLMTQPTGFQQQPQFGFQQQQQPAPFLNGQPTASPFADPRPGQTSPFQQLQPQQTGFPQPFQAQPQMPMATGINARLPPALQPQPTGINGFGNASPFGMQQQQQGAQTLPPMPPMPSMPTAAPLVPQKTGPAPPVRFGVQNEPKKLLPQQTGRRANLAAATPMNPFGF